MKWIIFFYLLTSDIILEVSIVECAPQRPSKRNKDTKKNSSDQKINKKSEKNGGKKKRADTQIVGGINSNGTRWPWQIAILTLQDGQYKFRCGGSLVVANVVLTAAHCLRNPDVTPSMVTIIAGDYDRTLNDGTEQTRDVSKITVHPGYTGTLSSLYSNDIALMKLSQPVSITDSVSTISLTSQNKVIESTSPCLITGWGISNTKKSTNSLATKLSQGGVGILTNDDCNKKKNWDGLVKQFQMCAYNKRISACLGDSGGPLVCRVNNSFEQYGVTSWGSKFCDRKPSVFTRISYYHTWLTDTMAEF